MSPFATELCVYVCVLQPCSMSLCVQLCNQQHVRCLVACPSNACSHGIKGLVIDPYNELDKSDMKDDNETQYVSAMLGKVKRFAQVSVLSDSCQAGFCLYQQPECVLGWHFPHFDHQFFACASISIPVWQRDQNSRIPSFLRLMCCCLHSPPTPCSPTRCTCGWWLTRASC